VKTLRGLRGDAVGRAGKESRTNFELHPISALRASIEKGRLTAMPDEVQILITRADLPRADVAFGLDEKDFDLTKTKIWIDGAPVNREEPKQDPIKVKASLGDGPGTIVVTTEAGKLIGVINYDRTSGKIIREDGSDKQPTVPRIVNDAVDKVVRAIKEIKPAGQEFDRIIETAADRIVKAINGMRAEEGTGPKKRS
jgi:hypothetical protein